MSKKSGTPKTTSALEALQMAKAAQVKAQELLQSEVQALDSLRNEAAEIEAEKKKIRAEIEATFQNEISTLESRLSEISAQIQEKLLLLKEAGVKKPRAKAIRSVDIGDLAERVRNVLSDNHAGLTASEIAVAISGKPNVTDSFKLKVNNQLKSMALSGDLHTSKLRGNAGRPASIYRLSEST